MFFGSCWNRFIIFLIQLYSYNTHSNIQWQYTTLAWLIGLTITAHLGKTILKTIPVVCSRLIEFVYIHENFSRWLLSARKIPFFRICQLQWPIISKCCLFCQIDNCCQTNGSTFSRQNIVCSARAVVLA